MDVDRAGEGAGIFMVAVCYAHFLPSGALATPQLRSLGTHSLERGVDLRSRGAECEKSALHCHLLGHHLGLVEREQFRCGADRLRAQLHNGIMSIVEFLVRRRQHVARGLCQGTNRAVEQLALCLCLCSVSGV